MKKGLINRMSQNYFDLPNGVMTKPRKTPILIKIGERADRPMKPAPKRCPLCGNRLKKLSNAVMADGFESRYRICPDPECTYRDRTRLVLEKSWNVADRRSEELPGSA